MRNRFIVIVPTYNSEQYIEKCIMSVLLQDYDNYKLIVINDCSTDDTHEIICKLLENHNFSYVVNESRVGSALANFIKGKNIASTDKEDILITVDGDDYLDNNGVLSYVNGVYQDNDVWLTYGQFRSESGKVKGVSQPLHDISIPTPSGQLTKISLTTDTYRSGDVWATSHLRTLKRWLFDKIKDEDLRNADGEYYKTCCDVSYMYPAVEMAGDKHIRFIPDILYVYNDMTDDYGKEEIIIRNIEAFKRVLKQKPYSKL